MLADQGGICQAVRRRFERDRCLPAHRPSKRGGWLHLSRLEPIRHLGQSDYSRFFIAVYLFLFFLARHYWIIKPGLNRLDTELHGLKVRLIPYETAENQQQVAHICDEIQAIRTAAEEHRIRQFILGNTGKKISCWRRYNEIERLTVKSHLRPCVSG